MAENDNPLIKTLPPATDYLTYLAIIEYNLSKDNLKILDQVLQDEALTINIGWDLIHLLLPFLPESQECLHTVARLGNPREVILKVTESLRLIEYDDLLDPDISAAEDLSQAEKDPIAGGTHQQSTPNDANSIQRFTVLLNLLATLHRRIKTKYPSRFLSSSLQAVLASFSNSPPTSRDQMVLSIAEMIKKMSNIARPNLPSRQSSSQVSASTIKVGHVAVDPEASKDSDDSPAEFEIQLKLFQSFLSHVAEEYMLNMPEIDHVPGMAWCSRLTEKDQPELKIRTSSTLTERFVEDVDLHHRLDIVGILLNVAKDLKITDDDLLKAALARESVPLADQDEDEPPNSADDIELSRLGSLFLYAARNMARILYGNAVSQKPEALAIFPQHQELLKNCLSSSSSEQGIGQLGTEPVALIDAVLALGLLCLDHDSIGAPASDEQFSEYLQVVALLSSNCPNPTIRGHAHYLTTTILRSHPDDAVKLAFIKDTLEHCPFENLKVSAVSWTKGAIIEANPPSALSKTHGEPDSIFTKPQVLDNLAPYLFPSVDIDLLKAPVSDAWITWQTNLSFYLASLNFLYLLLCAQHLHDHLEIRDLWINNDIAGSFVHPLREARARFLKEFAPGGALKEDHTDAIDAEMSLMEDGLDRVTSGVKLLNAST